MPLDSLNIPSAPEYKSSLGHHESHLTPRGLNQTHLHGAL
jgi:hypothetical protein